MKIKQAEKKEEYISNTLLTLCALRPFSNRSQTPCKVLEEKNGFRVPRLDSEMDKIVALTCDLLSSTAAKLSIRCL